MNFWQSKSNQSIHAERFVKSLRMFNFKFSSLSTLEVWFIYKKVIINYWTLNNYIFKYYHSSRTRASSEIAWHPVDHFYELNNWIVYWTFARKIWVPKPVLFNLIKIHNSHTKRTDILEAIWKQKAWMLINKDKVKNNLLINNHIQNLQQLQAKPNFHYNCFFN